MYIVVSKKAGTIVGANGNLEWAPGVPADEEQVRKIAVKLREEADVSYLDALRDGSAQPVVYLRKNARAAAKKLSEAHSCFEWEVYQVQRAERKVGERPLGWQIMVRGTGEAVPSAWNYPPAPGMADDDYVAIGDTFILKTRKAARAVLERASRAFDPTLAYKMRPIYNEEEVSNG